MASTYASLIAHVVFATHGRQPMLVEPLRSDLHKYMFGTLEGLGVKVIAIGGVEDHVHFLIGLRTRHSVSELVREVKKASSAWVADRVPGFRWQEGYGAFSIRYAEVEQVSRYVAAQEEHHRQVSSADELRRLLAEHGVEFDERFFE